MLNAAIYCTPMTAVSARRQQNGQVAGAGDTVYGSEGWGFESLRARQVTGLYSLWDGLVANGFANTGHQPNSIAWAKMTAASASCSLITWA
jgi:hypothetical protein